MDFICGELPGFAARLAELTAAIFDALNAITGAPPSGVLPPEALVSLLRGLRAALAAQKQEDIDRILEELDRQASDPAILRALKKISDQVLMTEFEEAIETIDGLGYVKL